MLQVLSSLFVGIVFAANVENRNIQQPLDHSLTKVGSYQQSIQILRPDQMNEKTTVVLFLGSEAGPGDLTKLAAPFLRVSPNLVFVQADHRGYGSYSDEEDQTVPSYVSMDQAIEDFHAVILELKKEFQGPIFLVGYSYSATIAIRLAAKYPDDARGVYASSATVRFPKSAVFHDAKMQASWSPELYRNLSAKMQSYGNPDVGSQNFLDRLFLQTIFVGSVQYAKFARLTPYLEKTSLMPLDEMIKTWKGLDQQFASGTAQAWSEAQNTLKLNRADAQSMKYHSRYWAYQQCTELGSFFMSSQADGIFTNNFADYSDYCVKMFGFEPKVQSEWNFISEVAKMSTPLIVVNGKNDPWFEIQLTQDAKLPAGSQFLLAEKGYHCPDREDVKLEKQAITALLQLAP